MEADQTIDVAAAWHELGDRLRVYVARRVNPGDADDVVQSVMVKLLERRGEIDTFGDRRGKRRQTWRHRSASRCPR